MKSKTHKRLIKFKDEISSLYEEGYGFKYLAKKYNASYTSMRGFIYAYTDVIPRKGYNVVTNKLREIRSQNVKGHKNPWYKWPERKPEMIKNNKKGIQGYYNEKWLRSTHEYIFAKWLDKYHIKWGIEDKLYKLSNGESVRPDFFIYNSKNELILIVEIKGYWKRDLYKIKILQNEIKTPIITIVEDEILQFTNNIEDDRKQWKLLSQK